MTDFFMDMTVHKTKVLNSFNSPADRLFWLGWLLCVLAAIVAGGDAAAACAYFPALGFVPGRSGLLFDKADDGGGSSDGGRESSGNSDNGDGGPPPSPRGSEAASGGSNGAYDSATDALLADAMEATEKMHGGEDGGSDEDDGSSDDSPAKGGQPSGKKDDTKGSDAGKNEPADDDDSAAAEGFESDDLVEVGDESFFYHPNEHGKDTGQGTTYKSRDAAEHGLPNKVAKIKEDLQALNDTELGIGPVTLPEWIEKGVDNPDALDEYLNIEYAIGQPNDQLRNMTAEADRVITQLNTRQDQLHTKKNQQENKQQLDELAAKAQDNAVLIRNGLDYSDDDLQGFQSVDELQSDMESRIDDKIRQDLADDVEEYKSLMNADADRRMDDDYAQKLDRKKESLYEKERELRKKYHDKYFSGLKELQQAQEEAQKLQGELESGDDSMTTQQLQQKQETGYMDFQDFLANQPQDQQPAWFRASNPEGMKDFWNFAVNRASTFGDLTSSYQWRKAANAYGSHLKDLRAKARKQQVESDNKQQKKKNDEIPGYGNQDKIKSGDDDKKRQDKQTALKNEMDQMEEMTKEAIS